MFNRKHYRISKLPSPKLIFSYFYTLNRTWKRYLVSIICSIIVAFLYWFFIQFSGIYSAGLASFSQGFSRISQVLIIRNNTQNAALAHIVGNIIFWTLFLVLNIPLAIFSYFKVGKNFTKMTIISLTIGDIFGLGLGFIPNSENIVFIFGNPLSTFTPLQDGGVQILLWKFSPDHHIYDLVKIIPLLFYAIVSSMLIPLVYSLIYIVGSSTGGTDFISYYYSMKKNKPLGSIIAIFNTIALILGTFIGTYLSASLINVDSSQNSGNFFVPWSFELFLSPNLIASAIASILLGLIVNKIFPKSRMAQLKIYSANVTKITNDLLCLNYPHSFTIYNAIGAFSNKEIKTADTICWFIEIPTLMKQINKIDSKALISVSLLNHVKGQMNIFEKID